MKVKKSTLVAGAEQQRSPRISDSGMSPELTALDLPRDEQPRVVVRELVGIAGHQVDVMEARLDRRGLRTDRQQRPLRGQRREDSSHQ